MKTTSRIYAMALSLVYNFLVGVTAARTGPAAAPPAAPSKVDVFDVVKFAAEGDGKTDDTKAFSDAWAKACNGNSRNPVFQIPEKKTFLVTATTFQGPCKAPIDVKVLGTIVAPKDLDNWDFDHSGESKQWLAFDSVHDLAIYGNGTVDGRGTAWWNRPCTKKKTCKKSPTALTISNSNNVTISDLLITNSPQMHLMLLDSTNVVVTGLTVMAPGDSPNTDGIHIQDSHHVQIFDSTIGTGDDCISISSGTSWVDVTGVSCGPGHGISIGSLGWAGESDTVEYVKVNNCTFNGTTNGARIKTKPGGKGFARNIVFEHIQVTNVTFPIIIDQYYPENPNKRRHMIGLNDDDDDDSMSESSAVKVSNVTYNSFNGTSDGQTAVSFICSRAVPCTGVVLQDIDIAVTVDGNKTSSYCENASGYFSGRVAPKVSCLGAKSTSPPVASPRPQSKSSRWLTHSLRFC